MNHTFDPQKLSHAWETMDGWVERGECPAVVTKAGFLDGPSVMHTGGRLHPDAPEQDPVSDRSIFLIASPTKPIVATGLMMLAEQGELLLVDPISKYIPEFTGNGKEKIELLHCLTHTSGLPDMLPENIELRKRHAPLSEYLPCICNLTPDFAAGTKVSYQSTGYLLLSEVVQRITGTTMPEFLQQHVFHPLKMYNTSLGMPDEWTQEGPESRINQIATNKLPPESEDNDWGWNSDYWRRLGAPWGGLLASAGDLAIFCRHLLAIHRGQPGVLSTATLTAMTTNQLATMPEVPESNRRCTPWGYGWQLNWPNHPRTFGDFLPPSTYGHWGATGTMLWIDPSRDAYCVALTTGPMEDNRRRLANLSNTISTAISCEETGN